MRKRFLIALAVLVHSGLSAQAAELQCGKPALPALCRQLQQRFSALPGAVHVELAPAGPAPLSLVPGAFYWQAIPDARGLKVQIWGASEHGHPTGLASGAYDLLERVGLRFNHPLQPEIPAVPDWPRPGESRTEAPRWSQRGVHLHTMHPLELTHVLNGWGPGGPSDAAGWERLRGEWQLYLEWLLANRQNEVEWVLLEKGPWQSFSRSHLRQERLRLLVEQAHALGLRVGIDVPLTLAQQNAWRLLPERGQPADEQRQIEQNLDWLLAAGFDFISTELGLSEFHNAGDREMLRWLNLAVSHLSAKQVTLYTKIHISKGQESTHYRDPEHGGPLNFNFLPLYADARLGIMPHTVQIYSLDDPAPVYGQQDFTDMRRLIALAAGKRPVLWYPESSYWVNYDINVPLFLPVYAARRLHDLRLLDPQQPPIQGQMLFSSGLEWGYWLNDRISSRAAWQPGPESESLTLRRLVSEALLPLGTARTAWVELLLDTISAQEQLLIHGEVGGQRPPTVVQRNGMAYLAGQDTWSEVARLLHQSGWLRGFQTQPERLEPGDLRHDPAVLTQYQREVRPLLNEMYDRFGQLARRAEYLPRHHPLAAELYDGLRINALRAEFVRARYEQAALLQVGQHRQAEHWLRRAGQVLAQAQKIVSQRERFYRADPERIAGWGGNPTAYPYGYLWQARALSFWRRDLRLMEGQVHLCGLNVIDPLEVALPDPDTDLLAARARLLTRWLPLWRDCLHPPLVEPAWARTLP